MSTTTDQQKAGAVKRLIRKVGTGLYYGGKGWTNNPALATNFASFTAAIHTSMLERLSSVEVVLQFGEEPSDMYDISLPLSERLSVTR